MPTHRKTNAIAAVVSRQKDTSGQIHAAVSTALERPITTSSFQVKQFRAEPKGTFTIDVLIDGAKTRCLLESGSEVTTISAAYLQKQFEGKVLFAAKWIKLTAANGLHIPVTGCLYADAECTGK